MRTETSRHESPIGIVAAAYAVADDERDGLALVEILGSGGECRLHRQSRNERSCEGRARHGTRDQLHDLHRYHSYSRWSKAQSGILPRDVPAPLFVATNSWQTAAGISSAGACADRR